MECIHIIWNGARSTISRLTLFWSNAQIEAACNTENRESNKNGRATYTGTIGRRMKALVILVLGVMLVSSCFAMPRKVLSNEIQADDKAGESQGLVDRGNSEKVDAARNVVNTNSHHQIPAPNSGFNN
ncbi:uncharacterized protein A4U43_C04F17850 [Asparagus officinalis]|uniref:Uncharacterized protein n=1 Tax=Asparagus officinalis TaxID=4686 RepID=A0A5P1F1S0_ASPOF|nr:uncharacterized protein A4U43_C04F17850 [Asparagus officinalis]